MVSYVYLITNIITEKYYIGKTNNKTIRWSQHKSKSKTSDKNMYLYNSIRKYGHSNFTFEIIKECLYEDDAYEYERVLIELFSLRDKKYGYNIIEGGSGRSKGYKVKESIKMMFRYKYSGSKSVRAKFSDNDILQILSIYSGGDISAQELATKYHCGKSTIIRIISGTAYKNVPFDRSKFSQIAANNRINRIPRGDKSKSAKLSNDNVYEIRRMFESRKYTYQQLADLFGVTKTNIYYIINKISRRDL